MKLSRTNRHQSRVGGERYGHVSNGPCAVVVRVPACLAFRRFDAQTGADREVQRILLELLNQMDGFDQTTTVKVCRGFCGSTESKMVIEVFTTPRIGIYGTVFSCTGTK